MHPQYENECYECGHGWDSEDHDESCPDCGELDNIGTDYIIE